MIFVFYVWTGSIIYSVVYIHALHLPISLFIYLILTKNLLIVIFNDVRVLFEASKKFERSSSLKVSRLPIDIRHYN